MSRALVVLNAGSSSLKFSLFESDGRERLELRARGRAEGIGSGAHFFVQDGAGRTIVERALDRGSAGDHAAAFALVDEWLRTELDGASPLAVGHRVVHGGRRFVRPVRVDAEGLEEIEALIPLAPLHQAHAMAVLQVNGRSEEHTSELQSR